MAFARAVRFEGVNKDRIEQMKQEMNEGGRPDELPATEIVVLHDGDAEESLVLVFFDSEEDYNAGDAYLNSMPSGDTPGSRASVKKYDVAVRMTA